MLPTWKLKRIAYNKLPTEAEISALTDYKDRLRVGRIIDERRKAACMYRQKRAMNTNRKHIKFLALQPGDWTDEGEYVRTDDHYIYIKNIHSGVTQIGLANPNLLMLRRATEAEFLLKKSEYSEAMMKHIETLPRLKMD